MYNLKVHSQNESLFLFQFKMLCHPDDWHPIPIVVLLQHMGLLSPPPQQIAPGCLCKQPHIQPREHIYGSRNWDFSLSGVEGTRSPGRWLLAPLLASTMHVPLQPRVYCSLSRIHVIPLPAAYLCTPLPQWFTEDLPPQTRSHCFSHRLRES